MSSDRPSKLNTEAEHRQAHNGLIRAIRRQRSAASRAHIEAEEDAEQDRRDRRARFLILQHAMAGSRQLTQNVRVKLAFLRQWKRDEEEKREKILIEMGAVEARATSYAQYQEEVEPLVEIEHKIVRKLNNWNDQIAKTEAQLVRFGSEPRIPDDYKDLVAEFDPQPIRLIGDGRGLFPISPRIQALDG